MGGGWNLCGGEGLRVADLLTAHLMEDGLGTAEVMFIFCVCLKYFLGKSKHVLGPFLLVVASR